MPGSLKDKAEKLAGIIGRQSRVVVACSGGVDSTLLLKVCCDVLGREKVVGAFVDTPLLPPGESKEVREVVDHIGCRLHISRLDPFSWPDFTANPPERCYLCKKKIYLSLLDELADNSPYVLLDGTNLDDISDHRPGLKALDELGIEKPLAGAGLTKKDVRRLSRELNLPTWNKYSSSCLATRIATDQKITMDAIDFIGKCEGVLMDLGFPGCRVRLDGDAAVIELPEEDISRFVQQEARFQVMKKINDSGVKRIFLNLAGRKGILR